MPCLIEPNVFRQSSPFTICDLSEWEKAHPGSKPIALEATPFDGEAGRRNNYLNVIRNYEWLCHPVHN